MAMGLGAWFLIDSDSVLWSLGFGYLGITKKPILLWKIKPAFNMWVRQALSTVSVHIYQLQVQLPSLQKLSIGLFHDFSELL